MASSLIAPSAALIAAGLAAAGLWGEMRGGQGEIAALPSLPQPAARPVPVSVTIPNTPAGRFSVIAERPVFSPGRRPAERAVAAAPPPAPPALKVTGIFGAEGRQRALVHRGRQGQEWIGLGETVGGWRVGEIGPEGLMIERGGVEIRVPIGEEGSPSRAVVAASGTHAARSSTGGGGAGERTPRREAGLMTDYSEMLD